MEFRGRLLTMWLVLLASLLCAWLAFMVRHALPWQGWLGAVLFSACACCAGLAIYQGRPVLYLSKEGLVWEGVFHTKAVRWNEVEGLRTFTVRGNEMIELSYRAAAAQFGARAQVKSQKLVIANIYDAPLLGIYDTLSAWKKMYGSLA